MGYSEQQQPISVKHTVKQGLEHHRREWAFKKLEAQSYYVTTNHQVYVVVPGRNGTLRHLTVDRDGDVGGWLMLRYAEEHTGDTLTEWDLHNAILWFKAYALENGQIRDARTRVAPGADHSIWLDLGERVVHLMPGAWEVVEGSAVPQDVCFRRPHGYLPIEPEPVHGGNINALRHFIHCGDGPDGDERWRLIVGWLLGTLLPWGDYGILVLSGEPNAGKSTAARFLRNVVDPNAGELNRYKGKEQDIVVQATNAWVTVYDNVSHISQACSDVFCQLATGMGETQRKLYTNNDPLILTAHGPVILNGIQDFVKATDLVSRTLRVHLPAIPDLEESNGEGITRTQLDMDYAEARPRILGALLDVAAAGLARLAEVEATPHPFTRMSDLRNFVTACEPALGWEAGTWDRITKQARVTAHAKALEGTPVMDALLNFLADPTVCRDRCWEGPTLDLHKALKDWARDHGYNVYDREWPASPQSLGKRLLRLSKSSLNAIGIAVETYMGGPREARTRCVRLIDQRPLATTTTRAA